MLIYAETQVIVHTVDSAWCFCIWNNGILRIHINKCLTLFYCRCRTSVPRASISQNYWGGHKKRLH